MNGKIKHIKEIVYLYCFYLHKINNLFYMIVAAYNCHIDNSK